MEKFVLIQKDNVGQILELKGPYSYKEGFEILENGHKRLGGEMYVPKGNNEWVNNSY